MPHPFLKEEYMELTKDEIQELIDQQIEDITQKYGNQARLQVLQIISLIEKLSSTGSTRYIAVPDWNLYHERPTVSGLRSLIARADDNGFNEFKVVHRKGRRVFIDEARYMEWFRRGNK
nr:MAG TPA: hypothetical protein [Caudoviricetes sp.]